MYHDQMVHVVNYADRNIRLMDRAMQLMVEKHAILRTAFYLGDDDIYQVVFKHLDLNIVYEDVSEKAPNEQLDYVEKYLEEDRKDNFGLNSPGLWRLVIFSLGEDSYCICFICHHAIFDGWSDASFNTELNNIFIALHHQPEHKPKGLKSTYKDYIVDQIVAERNSEVADYWKLELSDYKRFAFTSTDERNIFKAQDLKVSPDIQSQLLLKSKEAGVSLKHICFAAFAYSLRMFSYENDITLGLVTNNRSVMEDGDRVLGCFLNTAPIRLKIPQHITWNDYLHFINDKLNATKKYDKLSLFKIMEAIGEKASDRNPITDIIFNFIDFHIYDELKESSPSPSPSESIQEHENLALKSLGGAVDNALFSFIVNRTGGDLTVTLNHDTSFVDEATARKILTYFNNTLALILQEPTKSLGDSQILSEQEEKVLIEEFNRTIVSFPQDNTVIDLFEKQAMLHPDSIALIKNDEHFTYEELNTKANQLACRLKKLGLKKGEVVSFMLDRSFEMIVSILGILKAEGTYLALSNSHPESRLKHILEVSRASIVITKEDTTLALQNNDLTIVHIDINEKPSIQEPENTIRSVTMADNAYITFTSGSTGLPKGVVTSYGSVTNLIYSQQQLFGIGKQDKILQFSSITFDASVEQIWLALSFGASLVLVDQDTIANTEKFNNYIAEQAITHIHTTPSFLESILLDDQRSLKRIVVGGEECSTALASRYGSRYKFYNEYGPTETTVTSTVHCVDSDTVQRRIPIGRPIANTLMYLFNEDMKLVPEGSVGELCIAGEGLAKGYLNDETLTDQKFTENPIVLNQKIYRTGDLAKWNSSGELEFLGRIDDQVKIRGFRIELGEIENQLIQHDMVKEAVVLVKGNSDDKYIIAYYTSENELAEEKLKAHLSSKVPSYMIPSHFYYLPTIPLTLNGKVDRKQLLELEVLHDHEYEAPANEVEEKLLQIWSGILRLEADQISVTQNFFELGGHSLRATNLVGKINKEMGVDIPLQMLFEIPTIREIASFIASFSGKEDELETMDSQEEFNF